jgi:hypothetical protein
VARLTDRERTERELVEGREVKLRNELRKFGYALQKVHPRYYRARSQGGYQIIDATTNAIVAGSHADQGYALDLHGAEMWLQAHVKAEKTQSANSQQSRVGTNALEAQKLMSTSLKLVVPGATPTELARGKAAAWEVFRQARVSPAEGAAAVFKQETPISDPDDDPIEMSPRETIAAETWRDAYQQGVAACCRGWASVPEEADMVLAHGRGAEDAPAGQSHRADLDKALLRAVRPLPAEKSPRR